MDGKICPRMSLPDQPKYCEEGKCAWWIEIEREGRQYVREKGCATVMIALAIKELSETQAPVPFGWLHRR